MSRHEWPVIKWRSAWVRLIYKAWPWSEFGRLQRLAGKSWEAWEQAQDDLKQQQEDWCDERAEFHAIEQNLIAGLDKLEKSIARIKADLRNARRSDR
jgi:hypothetical protein